MLEGIRAEEIIVGAYTNGNGICPMLAAHRRGGRTDFISFAKAWDRFALGQSRRRHARKATRRELLVLTAHLEASLLADDGPSPALGGAIAEHLRLTARRAAPPRSDDADRDRGPARRDDSDRDRGPELRATPGWSWLRVTRRYDDFQRSLWDAKRAELDGHAEPLEAIR
jgi:hypothetical protein